MFASLPMYDRPENRAAHDGLWAAIRDGLRARGVDAPDMLDRETHHMEGWGRPDLVLGQICNLPYRAQFRDRVTAIGASDYGLPDTPAGDYHSLFIVRADDPATAVSQAAGYRFAYNEGLSQSGWGAPHDWAASQGLRLNPTLHTGAHVESLRAVVEGRADLASIDAQSFRNFTRWNADARRVKIIGRTHSTPGMTFITAKGNDPAPYFAAIADAIAGLTPETAAILNLQGIVSRPQAAYDLPLPPAPMPL